MDYLKQSETIARLMALEDDVLGLQMKIRSFIEILREELDTEQNPPVE